MKRIIVLVVLSMVAVVALVGCGGGGGGVGTPADAANFSVLNAGVYKNVSFYSGSGEVLFTQNITSAITVSGNMVSLVNNSGKEEVLIGGTVRIQEN